jgi:4-hydroxy-tetrahydrodipicolinate reductase
MCLPPHSGSVASPPDTRITRFTSNVAALLKIKVFFVSTKVSRLKPFTSLTGNILFVKVALVGYGKMGKMIEQLAPEYGINISARIDQDSSLEEAQGSDCAIEFTTPETAVSNLLTLAKLRIPTVCGTTGWYSQLNVVQEAFNLQDTPFVYGSNFSVGVAVFRELIAEAARRFATLSEYEAFAYEAHHSAKKDAPSGTLKTLIETMRQAGYSSTIDEGWNRAGKIPGTHEIGFDGPADTITLKHVARSREGFARGALVAAKWIQGKKGVHEFNAVIAELSR